VINGRSRKKTNDEEANLTEKKIISVFGSSATPIGSPAYEEAQTLGRLLAEAGFDVINGGYYGTMEAVSRGAKEGGAQVTGITLSLFDARRPTGNAWLNYEIKKDNYLDRLRHLTTESSGCIALAGSVGTLTEVFMTWSLIQIGGMPAKPLILVGDPWRRVLRTLVHERFIPEKELKTIIAVVTPEEAVQAMVSKLAQVVDKKH
jgi:uncharacterized protein (TIGR00730 family)